MSNPTLTELMDELEKATQGVDFKAAVVGVRIGDISRLTAALRKAKAALEDIAAPTYGTELINTKEENNEILARHHFSNQATARAALKEIENG
jgi:hypothetical protein